MNKIFLGLCVVALSALVISCSSTSKLKTQKVTPSADTLINTLDSFAYGLGMNIGNNLKEQGVTELNFAALQKGMKDVFASSKTTITEQDANGCIQTVLQGLAEKKSAAERAAGIAFLDSNKLRPGVITLPSGLQYEVLKAGDSTSAMPKANDMIVAHYAGSLINGKEFDNSYKRGQPLTIKANEVIEGWTQMLQLMHIGEKVKIFIPSKLGYGERGAGGEIPPGAALIFEMELLGINPPAAKQPESMVAPGKDDVKVETVPVDEIKNEPAKTKPAKEVKSTTTKKVKSAKH